MKRERKEFSPAKILVAALSALLLSVAGCTKKPVGPLAYVSNEHDGTVTVIDTHSDQVVDTILVGSRPRGIRFDPAGHRLYVALSTPTGLPYTEAHNKIAAIDVVSSQLVKKYDVGRDPEQLAIAPDGKTLYASNEDTGTLSITNLETGESLGALVVGIEPEGVTISPDGRWVYVTAETSNTVSVVETKTNQVITTFLVGARPRDSAFSRDGTRAYVSAEMGRLLSVIDVATHKVIKNIELPHEEGVRPMGVAVTPDGRFVYVALGRANKVLAIDATNWEIVASIPVGQRVWGLAITPDGRKLYTANGLSNDVSVIETSSNRVIATIKVGNAPWGIAIGAP